MASSWGVRRDPLQALRPPLRLRNQCVEIIPGLPEMDLPVGRDRCHAGASGRKGHTPRTSEEVRDVVTVGVPQPHRATAAHGDQASAPWIELCTQDDRFITLTQREQLISWPLKSHSLAVES